MLGSLGLGFLFTPVAVDVVVTHPQPLQPFSAGLTRSPAFGAKTNTQPVNELLQSKSGVVGKHFGFNDWYNRIHVEPRNLDLGNILSTQIRSVTVWNATLDTVQLTDIQGTGADSITLSGDLSMPVTYQPLQAESYTVTTDLVGPPVIDGAYSFTFDTPATLTVAIIGKRVVVFPFSPQTPWKESLEWKTDVMKSKAKEQRVSLRPAPRQEFEHTYFLNESQYSRLRAMSYGWLQRVFAVPVWQESTFLGSVPSGATALSFNTNYADYREGDVLLLWESDRAFETCEIDTIENGEIYLTRSTVYSYTAAYVAPLRFARCLAGIESKRGANKLVISNATFQVTSNADLSASISLPQYKGVDVLTDTMMKVSDPVEKIICDIEVIDNGTAPVAVHTNRTVTDQTFTVSWACATRADLWRVRQWLHSRKGKTKPFWLPTGSNDFTLLDNVTPSSGFLVVSAVGYAMYYGVRDILIRLKNGTTHMNRVLSGEAIDSTSERLTLQNAVGLNFSPAEVDYCCLMHHVRLDADRIEINYDSNLATISIPVVEVPQ